MTEACRNVDIVNRYVIIPVIQGIHKNLGAIELEKAVARKTLLNVNVPSILGPCVDK